MDKKSTGHTIYQRILRVSVLGILVAMVLATSAGLWISLDQEREARDRTLTSAVQAAADALALAGPAQDQVIADYVQRTVSRVAAIDLVAVYDEDGTPQAYYDATTGENGAGQLSPLDDTLLDQLRQTAAPLLDDAQAPAGADHCAYAAVRSTEGAVSGYVMAGMYLRSIHQTVQRTLAVYLFIGLAALGVGILLSLRLARDIKDDLLGYEPDAFRDLFLRRMELLDALDEGLLAIDRDSRVLYLNRVAADLLSLDKKSAIGRPLAEIYPQSTIPRVMVTGQPEYNFSLESFKHVRILSDRMPVRRGGQIVGAVAIFRNRTEVANLARELTGVQHIVEAMRAYTHEFMNKLHVILGLLQLGEAKQAEEYVLQLTQTRAVSVRRISQQIAEPSVAALLIGKSCRAAELGVRLTLTPESRLRADNDFLPADSIITILGNLIENAFDALAASPADVLHEISVSVCESDQGLILSVDDNGPGMEAEMRAHLFRRGATTKGAGHGTGLFLVKREADTYGGEIRVESTKGVGSSFIVTFRPPQTEATGG